MEEQKYYQPVKINDNRHRTLMRLLLKGETLSSAATQVGLTVARASVIANSPLFKSELKRLQSEADGSTVDKISEIADPVNALFKTEALNSAKKIIQLRDNATDVRVQKDCAIEALDRGGYRQGDKSGAGIIINVSDSKMLLINRSLEELAGGEYRKP